MKNEFNYHITLISIINNKKLFYDAIKREFLKWSVDFKIDNCENLDIINIKLLDNTNMKIMVEKDINHIKKQIDGIQDIYLRMSFTKQDVLDKIFVELNCSNHMVYFQFNFTDEVVKNECILKGINNIQATFSSLMIYPDMSLYAGLFDLLISPDTKKCVNSYSPRTKSVDIDNIKIEVNSVYENAKNIIKNISSSDTLYNKMLLFIVICIFIIVIIFAIIISLFIDDKGTLYIGLLVPGSIVILIGVYCFIKYLYNHFLNKKNLSAIDFNILEKEFQWWYLEDTINISSVAHKNYFTKNYFIFYSYFLYVAKYEDIIWIYSSTSKYISNFTIFAPEEGITIKFRDGNKIFYRIQQNIDMIDSVEASIYQIISKYNPNVLRGYTESNKKLYNQIINTNNC